MANESASSALERATVPLGTTVALVVSKGPAPAPLQPATVPSVLGAAQADALVSIQKAGLNTQVFTAASSDVARGKVVGQWPLGGESAGAGSIAALLVSSGPPAEGSVLAQVPNVVGQSEADAHATLEQAGLRAQVIGEHSPTVPAGIVFGQLPQERMPAVAQKRSPWLWVALAALAVVAVVAVVFVLTGGGGAAEQVKVPNVVGMTQAEAQTALEDLGFTVGEIAQQADDEVASGTVLSQDPAADTEADEGSEVNLVVSSGAETIEAPDVVGRSRATAEQLIADAGLKSEVTEAPNATVAQGVVAQQEPKAGSDVAPGSVVKLTVSTGPEQPKNVSVPNVVGLTEAAAKQKIAEAGLSFDSIDTHNATVPSGQVISQAPPAGSSVAPGTQVAVLVSEGPDDSEAETSEVPGVVGQSLDEATAVLKDLGFAATSYKTDGSGKPANEVLYQTPAAGDAAPIGSQVVLIVSSGS